MSGIDIKPDAQGKVRDIYDLGDKLLMVATDRISAFDYILEDEIPHKGAVLTQISLFWLEQLKDVIGNHLISADVADLPEQFKPYADYLRGRFMLVKKAEMFPVECIVRGYLAGSGLKEYQRQGTVCGIQLPEDAATQLRDLAIKVYSVARDHAAENGIIIADTKFEFGVIDGQIILADEVLTPDSSRFWPGDAYEPGRDQASFDKQYVRDWLNANWDRQGNPPHLPQEVIERTSQKYIAAYEKISGKKFEF